MVFFTDKKIRRIAKLAYYLENTLHKKFPDCDNTHCGTGHLCDSCHIKKAISDLVTEIEGRRAQ